MAEIDNTLQRIYPGVRPDQKEYLTKESVRLNKGDGETIRHIIDEYIKRHPHKK